MPSVFTIQGPELPTAERHRALHHEEKEMPGTMLGAYDYSDMGQVDLFGLNEFGMPDGMNPLWGAVIGGGIGTGTAIAVRALGGKPTVGKTDWGKWSEGIGFAVGGLSSGLMMAFPGTRAAGWAGLAVSFMTNGLRALEQMFTKTSAATKKGAHVSGWGAAVIEPLDGVTIESLSPGTRDLSGFGVADIQSVPEAYGTIPGVYGPDQSQMPQLMAVAGPQLSMGAPPVDTNQQGNLPQNSYHVGLMNGPALSGLGASYGATLFGGE